MNTFFTKSSSKTIGYYNKTSTHKKTRRTHSKKYHKQNNLIPELKLLNNIRENLAPNISLKKKEETYVIAQQHILETTGSLFKAIIALGIPPENIFLIGKCYSTSSEIAVAIKDLGINLLEDEFPNDLGYYDVTSKKGNQKLWSTLENSIIRKQVSRLIILDDGGRCIGAMPESIKYQYPAIAAVEQTRSGLYSDVSLNTKFPIINVAQSAAKAYLESPLIAEAVCKKINNHLANISKESVQIGLVGFGFIGQAIHRYLSLHGFSLIIYDKETAEEGNNQLTFTQCLEDLVQKSDCIIGCTGLDIFKNIDILGAINGSKTFISTTSEDREFLSLIRQIHTQKTFYVNPLEDLVYHGHPKGTIKILSGGFPINFDRKKGNVPIPDIALTQGLMLAAFIQALLASDKFSNNRSAIIPSQKLDPIIQSYISQHWFTHQLEREKRVEFESLITQIIQSDNKNRYASPNFLKIMKAEYFNLYFPSYTQENIKKFSDINWISENSVGTRTEYPEFTSLTNEHLNFSEKITETALKPFTSSH